MNLNLPLCLYSSFCLELSLLLPYPITLREIRWTDSRIRHKWLIPVASYLWRLLIVQEELYILFVCTSDFSVEVVIFVATFSFMDTFASSRDTIASFSRVVRHHQQSKPPQ